jgi:hypothetical protein
MIDNIVTFIGIVVFVYLCYRVGLLINKVKYWRFTRAWQPLIEVVNGTVHEDPQGGGASSYLVGEWKGFAIHARMSPQVRTYGSDVIENRFVVGVAQQEGRASWRTVMFPELDLTSDSDPALAHDLRRAGVIALLQNAACSSARFEAHTNYLFLDEIVTPLWVPPPERFVVLLDVAVELARVQRDVNAAPNARAGAR